MNGFYTDWRHQPDCPHENPYDEAGDPDAVWCAKCEHWEEDCRCEEEPTL